MVVYNDSLEPLNDTHGNYSDCSEWQEAQHIVFQLANVIFMLSFLAPSSSAYHTVFLRGLSSVASLMIVLWSTLVTCVPDYLGWNLAFFIVNMAHIGYHVCTSYPVRFDPLIEDVYKRVFKPFEMPRLMFSELLTQGEVLHLSCGEVYALEEDTPCREVLSLLVCGRMRVTCENLFLHFVEPYHFLDSVEFEAKKPFCQDKQDFYQVSIIAVDDSRIISWKYHSFRTYLAGNQYIAAIFNCLIGKDIASKLYHIQEWLIKDNKQPKTPTPNSSLAAEVLNLNVSSITHPGYGSHDNITHHNDHRNRFSMSGPRGEAYWLGRRQCRLSLSDNTFETTV